MNEAEVNNKMQNALGILKSDLSSMRTGRATPGMVESIEVRAYGGAQKLKVMEMANINAPDPETLVIEPWDKSVIGEIKQGILAANIGLSPNIDGEIIRISLPPMTGEDRKKHVKLLSTKLESAKVMVRQIRQDAMQDIKSKFESKDISEDDKFAQEKKLQEITDDYTDKIEKLGEEKEKELLQV